MASGVRFSYYFFFGLSKLPNWCGKLYRGIDEHGVELVKRNYTLGKAIHWSAMSSATPDASMAKEFAGPGGILLRITAQHGKDIRQFSAIPHENEVMLQANSRMLVTSDPTIDPELGVEVIDLCEKTDDASFVF